MKNIITPLYALLIFALLFSTKAMAHNATISGTVINQATMQPLQNATVTLDGTSKNTLTDAFGRFSFKGLQETEYTLVVSYLGFGITTQTIVANELQPQNLTITLSASAMNLSEVSVTSAKKRELNYVSDIDMKLRPVRTTQDMLRNVPGLFIAQHAGGGKAEQIFLRGFDIDHGTDINITVDGMPVNMVSHAHGQGYSDLHFVIPESVESFAFGKGPYYTEVGDFGTAGYVAFKTKDALEENLVKTEAGNFNSYRAMTLLKMPFKTNGKHKQSGYIGGEYFYSDGPYEASQRFNRYNGIAHYNIYLNPNNVLRVSGSYFYSRWDASGQVPERAVQQGLIGRFGAIDNTEGGNTSRINANVQLVSQLSNGVSWKNQAYYSRYDFSLYSNFTFFLADSVNGDQIHQFETRNIFGYNTSFNKASHIGTKDLNMTLGAGIRYDDIPDNGLERTKLRQPLGEYKALGSIKQLNSFAYLNNNLELSRQFSINAGVRYDHINYTYNDRLDPSLYPKAEASVVSPKLNFIYTPTKNTRIFLNTGAGFHSNDARVAVPQRGKQIIPPAYGADLGITFKAFDKLIVTAALWTLYMRQEFVYVGDEGVTEVSGKTLRKGIDVSLRYQVLPWLIADADVNYSHARSAESGVSANENYIPLAPNFTSIGGLTAKLKNNAYAALRYRYIADRPANEFNTVTAKGYFINDLVCGYTLKKLDLSLSVENLFNVEWNEAQFDTESRLQNEAEPISELHYTPGAPFLIRAGIAYRF